MCCLGAGKHSPISRVMGIFSLMAFLLEVIQAVKIMSGYEVQEGLGRWLWFFFVLELSAKWSGVPQRLVSTFSTFPRQSYCSKSLQPWQPSHGGCWVSKQSYGVSWLGTQDEASLAVGPWRNHLANFLSLSWFFKMPLSRGPVILCPTSQPLSVFFSLLLM